MTERTVILKFWDGLNSELWEIMATMRTDLEIDDLNEIITKAKEAETARDERNFEWSRRTEGEKCQPKREWTRFKNRTGGNQHFKPNSREEKQAPNKPERVQANAVSPQNTPEQKNYSNLHCKKISRAKLDTLRAEGRCFNCKEVGHKQQNCPKLNSMKPPATTIRTGSVNLVWMDRLAEQKEKAVRATLTLSFQ